MGIIIIPVINMQNTNTDGYTGALEIVYSGSSVCITTRWVINYGIENLSVVFAEIPEGISSLKITGIEGCYVRELEVLPVYGCVVLNILKVSGCGIRTLVDIPDTVRYLNLCGNRYLHIFHPFPKDLIFLELCRQMVGVINIPPKLEICKMQKCYISRVENIPDIFHLLVEDRFDEQLVILDMDRCVSPYQDAVDEVAVQMHLHVINRPIYVQELLTPGQAKIIKCVNARLDVLFVETMSVLRRSVFTNAVNTISPIEQALVLGSNYPRRMTEFIVS